MDIKHDNSFGHADIDCVVPSIYTCSPLTNPNRALREACRAKQTKTGQV